MRDFVISPLSSPTFIIAINNFVKTFSFSRELDKLFPSFKLSSTFVRICFKYWFLKEFFIISMLSIISTSPFFKIYKSEEIWYSIFKSLNFLKNILLKKLSSILFLYLSLRLSKIIVKTKIKIINKIKKPFLLKNLKYLKEFL